jgi:hypothetical protein
MHPNPSEDKNAIRINTGNIGTNLPPVPLKKSKHPWWYNTRYNGRKNGIKT